VDLAEVEALLKRAIALDGNIPEAHFQLGNLMVSQHHYEQSIPEYQRAIALDPSLADAHYRLATDYGRAGDKTQAQAELAIYQKLRSEHLAEVDKERAEVRQFVYSSKSEPATKQ
jgi:tetratricopeptide (TPR) repeat protein